MRFTLPICICMLFSPLVMADQPITRLIDTTFENRIAELEKRDAEIQKLVGRTIGPLEVGSVAHLGRLDPRGLANKEFGMSVSLHGVDEIDTQNNFADFQSIKPADNDSIEINVIPTEKDIGKTYVVVFNVNAFGNFSFHKTKRIGNGKARRFGHVSGIGKGVSNIPFHFRVETDAHVTLTLNPETDDRWWFGSCDLYLLSD